MNTNSLSVTIAGAQDILFDKLMKPKSRIEASSVITMTDSEQREVEIFYRVIDACPNAQTDDSRDAYTIEQVLFEGKPLELKGHYEQELLEWLNDKNPEQVKF